MPLGEVLQKALSHRGLPAFGEAIQHDMWKLYVTLIQESKE